MSVTTTKQESLWTMPYILTIVAMFFTFIPFSLSLPVFPLYIMDGLHDSVQLAGLINTVFLLACVLFRTQTAQLEHILGKKNTLLLGCLLFTFSYTLYLMTTNIILIMIIRFFSGMCFAIVNTSLMSIGTQFAPSTRKSEGIAYLATITMVGWAIGPFIGLNLVQLWSFNGIFMFCSAMLFVGFLIGCCINMSKLGAKDAGDDIATDLSIHDFLEIKALPVCSVIFLVGISYASITSFIAVYANSLQLPAAGGYFFVVLAFFSAIARLFSGKFYERLGANFLIYPCFLFFSAGFLILSYAHTLFTLLLAATCIGIAFGTITLCTQTIAVQQAPKDRTSVVTATYFTFLDFGISVGSYLLASCLPLLGYAHLYLVLSPFMLAVSFVYFGVYGRKTEVCVQS